MRIVLTILLLAIVLTACQQQAALSLNHNNQNRIIVLQPFGAFDQQQLSLLQNRLANYFHIQVRILDAVKMPSFSPIYNDKIHSADSLIQFLLPLKDDSVVQVVGLTHDEIYTLKESKVSDSKGKTISYWDKVRGLGYISKNACIVSDKSLMSQDAELWHNRIWKSVLHEIGHNLGMEHCKDDRCLMSQKNGDIAVLNNSEVDFCKECRRKVN